MIVVYDVQIRKNCVHPQNIKHHPRTQIICSTLFELENHNIHTSVNSPANRAASSKNTTN